jgi:hypothetical protein
LKTSIRLISGLFLVGGSRFRGGLASLQESTSGEDLLLSLCR